MGKSEIRAKISGLHAQIHEYEKNIEDLLSRKTTINMEYAEIDKLCRIPVRKYDLSMINSWNGSIYREAENYRERIILNFEKERGMIENLLRDIDTAVGKLYGMINNCRAEISNLEAVLASMD